LRCVHHHQKESAPAPDQSPKSALEHSTIPPTVPTGNHPERLKSGKAARRPGPPLSARLPQPCDVPPPRHRGDVATVRKECPPEYWAAWGHLLLQPIRKLKAACPAVRRWHVQAERADAARTAPGYARSPTGCARRRHLLRSTCPLHSGSASSAVSARKPAPSVPAAGFLHPSRAGKNTSGPEWTACSDAHYQYPPNWPPAQPLQPRPNVVPCPTSPAPS